MVLERQLWRAVPRQTFGVAEPARRRIERVENEVIIRSAATGCQGSFHVDDKPGSDLRA